MSKIPETLTLEEADQLIDELKKRINLPSSKWQPRRNLVMTLLLLDAGLRVGECVQLLQTDLFIHDSPAESLLIPAEISKSKRSRQIPLTARLKNWIQTLYTFHWQPNMDPVVNYAFYVTRPKRHISTRQVERFLARAARQSINRKIHPHILRHTFASRLMRVTNARVVQQLLGHKRLTSTQIYCHPNQQDLTDAIGRLERPDIKGPSIQN